MNLRAVLKNRRVGIGITSFSLAMFYSLNLLGNFAWSDDWPLIEDNWSHSEHALRDGRPLFAILLPAQFYFASENPDFIWTTRIFGVVGISIVFLLFSRNVGKLVEVHANHSFALPFFLLPIFMSLSFFWIASWATIGTWSLSALLSVFAALLLLNSQHTRHKVEWFLLPLLLLSLSNLIYPLYSTFGFIFILANFMIVKQELGQRSLVIIQFVKLSILAIALWGLVIKLSEIFTDESLNSKVTDIVSLSDIKTKIYWLFSRVMVVSITPYNYHSNLTYVSLHLLVTLLVLFWVANKSKNEKRRFIENLLCCLVLMFVSIWPLVVSKQNYIDHRFLLVPSSLVLTFIMISMYKIYMRSKQGTTRKIVIVSLALTLGISALNQIYLLNKIMIRPSIANQVFIKKEYLRCAENGNVEMLLFNRDSYSAYYPYIGNFSTPNDLDHPWVPDSQLRVVLSEQIAGNSERLPELQITRVGNLGSPEGSQGTCIMDLNEVP